MTDQPEPTAETDSYTPYTRWHLERWDGKRWMQTTQPITSREEAMVTLARKQRQMPGREFRILRATTTYLLEADPTP